MNLVSRTDLVHKIYCDCLALLQIQNVDEVEFKYFISMSITMLRGECDFCSRPLRTL